MEVPVLHALLIAVIAAYDMYVECCEGGLDPEWFVKEKDRMSFRDFRLELSHQMLTYNPKDQLYLGNANFRSVTGKEKERQADRIGRGGEGRCEY